jgi:hypothetical protein
MGSSKANRGAEGGWLVSTIRGLLAITAGAAFGILAAELILGLGPRDAGICIAVMALCVIARSLVKAIEADRRKQRAYREAVWQRRIRDGIATERPRRGL